ncbi:MAG: restriction endonuclease subunit S [Candidatus Falkowbacteria bacterium]
MQKYNIKCIKDIANVILGYTFRSTLEKEKNGDILVLQARNITESLIIKESDLLRAYLGNNRTNALVNNNDVVLSSRGSFKSAVAQVSSQRVVASSSVYLIRLKGNELLPEYLAIYLNSSLAQKQIKDLSTGVVINSLLRRSVEGIGVWIPSLENQQKVIEVYNNNLRHQTLLQRKQLLTKKINEGLIDKLIKS